ncbi:MAG: hypothetical protein ACM3JH_10545 [Acidithiobacillales bacterium]
MTRELDHAWLCRTIIESSPVAILFADREGKIRLDGTRISIEFYILLLRAPDGEILGAAALIQDVTARWQQQKELKARLAALEASTKES